MSKQVNDRQRTFESESDECRCRLDTPMRRTTTRMTAPGDSQCKATRCASDVGCREGKGDAGVMPKRCQSDAGACNVLWSILYRQIETAESVVCRFVVAVSRSIPEGSRSHLLTRAKWRSRGISRICPIAAGRVFGYGDKDKVQNQKSQGKSCVSRNRLRAQRLLSSVVRVVVDRINRIVGRS